MLVKAPLCFSFSFRSRRQLISEGHVDTVRVYGPEERSALVSLKSSAPGGGRVCKVVLAPDPELLPHLLEHGVAIDGGNQEGARLNRAFAIQVRFFWGWGGGG